MFAPNSRYAGLTTYTVTMPDGSTVIATRLPLPNPLQLAGFHRGILQEPRNCGDHGAAVAARTELHIRATREIGWRNHRASRRSRRSSRRWM